MHKDCKSYDIANSLSEAYIKTLKVDTTLEPLELPFELSYVEEEEKVWTPIDLIFINTQLFSPAANTFRSTGKYTELHPLYDAKAYKDFWDEEERRRKEGYTQPCLLWDKGDGNYVLRDLHITGEHYGYLNYGEIKRVSAEALEKVTKAITLGDEIVLTEGDKVKDFPQFFDSDYFYFKALDLARKTGRHIVIGKARRKGFSYKNGWVAADKADQYRESTTVLAAYNSDSLYPEGTMTMANSYLQLLGKRTDWKKRRLIDRQDFIKFGYKYNDGLGIERGFLSRILAVSFAPNNPGAARGKDAKIVLWEESGKNRLLRASLDSTLPTLKAGIFVTGLGIVFGTGGGDDVEWEAFEELFYNPSADDFLCFDNIWDEDTLGTSCGFFVASFMGKEGFVDKWGNSNVSAAIKYEEKIRDKKRKSSNPNALNSYVMEEPFNPSEAFSRSGFNIFAAEQLVNQLRKVQKDPNIKALTRTGYLVNTGTKGIIFKDKMFMDEEELKQYHPPITSYPIKRTDDPHGCLILWGQPYRDRVTGLIPDNLYRIWHDPYAIPKSGELITARDSLGVFYIYERNNPYTASKGGRLIGEFVGRPDSTEAFNSIMFMASEYFNANILFERDRGDVYNYAKQHDLLHRLVDEPNIFSNKETTSAVNAPKGISMNNVSRKRDGVVYLRDWHIAPKVKDEFGNQLLELHYIYSERLLKEMIKYNLKGNFDCISTMIIGQYDMKGYFYTEIEKPIANNELNSIFDREWF